MSERFLLGLDLGGGEARCLLVGLETRSLHRASRPTRFRPVPGVLAGAELDPATTWSLVGEVVREAIGAAGIPGERIAGVAATAMRHGSVLLDEEGRELLATPNSDARGVAAIAELAERHGEELQRRTGHWPNPILPAARLRWMASHEPAAWERAAAHLSLSDWLAYRLCGVLASEPSQAGETLLFDLESADWAGDLIDRLELPRRIFPPSRAAGTPLGALSEAAAAELGLRPGTPVAVGGADTQCGLLGSGVVSPGQIGAVAGTSTPVQCVLDRALADGEGRLWTGHHVVPGLWVLESNSGGMGHALEWIAGLLYPEAAFPIVTLLAEAAGSSPGAAGFHSTLGAEVMNAREMGLPLGNLSLSPFAATDDPHRRRHLARAIVEGMACALRANLEQIEALAGGDGSPLHLSGGLSRSTLFARIVADVLGRPVEVTAARDASALGAAICAGVGAGALPDLVAGAERLVSVAHRYPPDPERAETYREIYAAWSDLHRQRRTSDAAAAGIALRALTGGAASAAARPSDFRPRILVSAEMDEAGLEALRAIGDVEHRSFREAMRLLVGPGLVEALERIHVFVTEVDVVDAESLLRSPDLRAVVTCRGDAVNVDLEACTALGIPVLHAPGRNADAVADLTLAFLLMLARKLPEASAFLREPGGEAGDMGRMGRAFGHLRGRELWRKTVGLVGLGAVGRKVVERLRPFGARCLVTDPHLDPDEVRLAGAEPTSLDDLLRASDFVSLHAAATRESRGLIGARELALMRPGSFLVNTARAALVDEDALIEVLRSGHLGGAALDVFAVEPPASDHPLLAIPQVIATPHVGGNTAEVAAHQGQIIAEDLDRMRRGERPHHVLNPETLSGFRWSEPRPTPSAELSDRLGRRAAPTVTDLERSDTRAPRPAQSVAAEPGTVGTGKVREAMETLLRTFLERLERDPELRSFARGRDVTLHFTLSDLGLEFHLGFRNDRVKAGLGVPEPPAAVRLKMKADLLDGMFTGRRNAMQAAMNGELSFSGDTAKAMTLQHINDDLSRLYREVREELGDPGDLTAIPGAGGGAPGREGSGDLRERLIEVVNDLYASRLITATGGNVSARIPGTEEAWITPSQLFKGDLCPEILVRIDMEGRAVDPEAMSPSSEALMHTAVLRARPEAQAVIHAHAPHATILANADLPFLPISTEAAFFTGIGRIPFAMPGTRELADAVIEAMGDGWAVLMKNHGVLVAGRTLRRAADTVEIIDRTAEVILGCYSVGVEPPTLPPETVTTLSRYGDLMA